MKSALTGWKRVVTLLFLRSGLPALRRKALATFQQTRTVREFHDRIAPLLQSSNNEVAWEAAECLARSGYADTRDVLVANFYNARNDQRRISALRLINKLGLSGVGEEVIITLEKLATEPPEQWLKHGLESTNIEQSLFFQACQYIKTNFLLEYLPRVEAVLPRVHLDEQPTRGYLLAEVISILAPLRVVPHALDMMALSPRDSWHGVELLQAVGALEKPNIEKILRASGLIKTGKAVSESLDLLLTQENDTLVLYLDQFEEMLMNQSLLKEHFERNPNAPFLQLCRKRFNRVNQTLETKGIQSERKVPGWWKKSADSLSNLPDRTSDMPTPA